MTPKEQQRKLRARAVELGMNEKALSKRLNMSQPTISRWLKNINQMKIEDFLNLCKVLKLPREDVLELLM